MLKSIWVVNVHLLLYAFIALSNKQTSAYQTVRSMIYIGKSVIRMFLMGVVSPLLFESIGHAQNGDQEYSVGYAFSCSFNDAQYQSSRFSFEAELGKGHATAYVTSISQARANKPSSLLGGNEFILKGRAKINPVKNLTLPGKNTLPSLNSQLRSTPTTENSKISRAWVKFIPERGDPYAGSAINSFELPIDVFNLSSTTDSVPAILSILPAPKKQILALNLTCTMQRFSNCRLRTKAGSSCGTTYFQQNKVSSKK